MESYRPFIPHHARTVAGVFNASPALLASIDGMRRDAVRELAKHRLPEVLPSYAMLKAAGYPEKALTGALPIGRTRVGENISAPNPLLPARVVFCGESSFEWANEAREGEATRVFAFLAHDSTGRACDVIAWHGRSGRVASLWGVAGVNDVRETHRPRIFEALKVHPSPKEWLLAGRAGVFVVDWGRAASVLREAQPLIAANVEHGCLIRDRLTPPALDIRVPLASVKGEVA